MKAYINAQKPKTISRIIHHTLVASNIFTSATKSANRFSQGEKSQQGSKPSFFNKSQVDKKKEKGAYKGNKCLSPEEIEHYRKENNVFYMQGERHTSRVYPMRATKKDNPQAPMIFLEEKQ